MLRPCTDDQLRDCESRSDDDQPRRIDRRERDEAHGILRCEMCKHHNGHYWSDGMSEKWCNLKRSATDVRDGCEKHSESTETQKENER